MGVDTDAERRAAARAANPQFVLRQSWLQVEEVIFKVEKDVDSEKGVLAKVLRVSPFLHQDIE